jgi:hypothetical protein
VYVSIVLVCHLRVTVVVESMHLSVFHLSHLYAYLPSSTRPDADWQSPAAGRCADARAPASRTENSAADAAAAPVSSIRRRTIARQASGRSPSLR